MINDSIVLGVYLTLSLFGLGVIVAESFGLSGDSDSDSTAGDSDADSGRSDHDACGEGAEGVASRGSQYSRSMRTGRHVFRALLIVRLAIYFCAGFGPMGLIATMRGESLETSLIWAVPAGFLVMIGAWALLKFQQREYDSSIGEAELVGREATVTIAIHPNEIGRVRIAFSQLTRDRYATAADNGMLPKGTRVRVVAVNRTDVSVEPLSPSSDREAL